MKKKNRLDAVYIPSEDVVARDVHGEFVIIPIVSGISDLENEILTLDETARAVWDKLDGKKTLKETIDLLSSEFEDSNNELEDDIIGFTKELLNRKIIVEIKKD